LQRFEYQISGILEGVNRNKLKFILNNLTAYI